MNNTTIDNTNNYRLTISLTVLSFQIQVPGFMNYCEEQKTSKDKENRQFIDWTANYHKSFILQRNHIYLEQVTVTFCYVLSMRCCLLETWTCDGTRLDDIDFTDASDLK